MGCVLDRTQSSFFSFCSWSFTHSPPARHLNCPTFYWGIKHPGDWITWHSHKTSNSYSAVCLRGLSNSLHFFAHPLVGTKITYNQIQLANTGSQLKPKCLPRIWPSLTLTNDCDPEMWNCLCLSPLDFVLFIYLAVLRIKARALHGLGKCTVPELGCILTLRLLLSSKC